MFALQYFHILHAFIVPELQQRYCLIKMNFMQDRVPPLTGQTLQQFLRQHFTVYCGGVANLNDLKDHITQHM